MSHQPNVENLELSDSELITVLKNHGMSRRNLMQVFGAGAVMAAVGGTAAASKGGSARIDEVFGAPYSAEESPPSGLVDHTVELRGPDGHGSDGGVHEMFPLVDSQEDGDFDPDSEVAEFFFDPVGLHVHPGDVVNFPVIEHHEHTVTAFAGKFHAPPRIPDVPGFSSPPIVGEESWLYRFEETGVYDLLCLPHVPLGMVMRVVVFDSERDSTDDISDYMDLPPAPVFANANTVLNAPELDDPVDIVNAPAGQVDWADLTI